MPIYYFECKACGHGSDEFFKMADCPRETMCPCCLNTKTFIKQVTAPATDMKAFHQPIELFSCAVNSVEEAIELRDKCPDADVNVDINHPDFGLPIARTRKAKMQVLAASGMRERN